MLDVFHTSDDFLFSILDDRGDYNPADAFDAVGGRYGLQSSEQILATSGKCYFKWIIKDCNHPQYWGGTTGSTESLDASLPPLRAAMEAKPGGACTYITPSIPWKFVALTLSYALSDSRT